MAPRLRQEHASRPDQEDFVTTRAVYLHIGAPKTGTSFLQRKIWLNRAELEEQGFRFPPGTRAAQFDAVADLRGGMWADKRLAATWSDLVAQVHDGDGVAVVSEELLCGTPDEGIERIMASLAPVPVHVVVGARDIARQIPAEWQQGIRARSATSYPDFLERLRTDPEHSLWQMQDPTKVYERWGPHLEPGHFHVLTLPPPGGDPDELWRRFCSVVGADPGVPHAPAGVTNPSLGLAEAEVLRRFNGMLGDRFPMRDRYIRVVRDNIMRDALLGSPDAEPIGLPAQDVTWLRERGSEVVERLRSLGDAVDVVGSLDDLLPGAVRSARLPADLSDGEILDAALRAWVRQHEVIEERMDRRAARRRSAAGGAQGVAAGGGDGTVAPATPVTERRGLVDRVRGARRRRG